MIRAIVAHGAEDVADLVTEVLNDTGRAEVVGSARSGPACLALHGAQGADAVFLDPLLPGMSGIEVAQRLLDCETPPAIVFIAQQEGYAALAYELGAVDYVLRAGDYEAFVRRLRLSLERVEEVVARRASVLHELRELVADLQAQRLHPLQRKIPVRDRGEGTVRLLDPAAIYCVERSQRQTVLCTPEHEYPTYYTIEALQQRLLPEGFFRANPSALLNANYIQHMVPTGDGSYDVVLGDDAGPHLKTIGVSRARSRELLDLLGM